MRGIGSMVGWRIPPPGIYQWGKGGGGLRGIGSMVGWRIPPPGIYRWHLPVFTCLENTPQVANTGKLIFFFFLP